jgi:hypothetical protein
VLPGCQTLRCAWEAFRLPLVDGLIELVNTSMIVGHAGEVP